MKALLFLLALAMATITGSGQNPAPSPAPATPPVVPSWRCSSAGGTYIVALRSIVSVSMHEYIVDAVARVTEVNVDTLGNMAARFYYIEPVGATTPLGIGQATADKARELLDQAASRSGQEEAWKKVVKNYPASTHSHTIEYRVSSREQLTSLFNSADTAFRWARDAQISVK